LQVQESVEEALDYEQSANFRSRDLGHSSCVRGASPR